MQKNFRPDQTKIPISLKFDEWIKLDNAFKQVVISPPLQYHPKETTPIGGYDSVMIGDLIEVAEKQ